jgi:hypothetical protein
VKKYKRRKNEREYIPRNIEKYVGQYPIIARSSWEYRFFQWADSNPSILEWSSEGHCINYQDPYQPNKSRRYYPDIYAVVKNKNGKHRCIIEIKPEKDTRLPRKKAGKSAKTLAMREHTYIVNQAKFKAAKEYCKRMGYEFVVLTEKQLFRNKRG